MAEIIIREIPFSLEEGLEPTPELEAKLDKAAVSHLSQKIIIRPWSGQPGRHSFGPFADDEDEAAGYQEVKLSVGGVETGILAAGIPISEITDDDIRIAKGFWLGGAFVSLPDENGRHFIDFD